jgi:hypothetical protein
MSEGNREHRSEILRIREAARISMALNGDDAFDLEEALEGEERRAETHAKINADVAKALGLPDGASWHDLGEKVAAVVKDRDDNIEALADACCDAADQTARAESAEKAARDAIEGANHNADLAQEARRELATLRLQIEGLRERAKNLKPYSTVSGSGMDAEIVDCYLIDDVIDIFSTIPATGLRDAIAKELAKQEIQGPATYEQFFERADRIIAAAGEAK